MSDGTHIEWTDATWNIVTGCSVVSPGCKHCYAMKLAGTRLKHDPSREGLTVETHVGPVWNGQVRFNEKWLDQPLRWKRPRKIFVCAHGDLFHESVPDEWIDKVFAVMALAPQHTFQVLTKRAERMHRYMTHWPDGASRVHHVRSAVHKHLLAGRRDWSSADAEWKRSMAAVGTWPLPNVWLGVSVEDQQRANERIPLLHQTPAAVRWLSCEPLLGPLDLEYPPSLYGPEGPRMCCGGFECGCMGKPIDPPLIWGLNWIVAGGESGHSARPMHPEWARGIRDQCAAYRVPFLFKQWGSWVSVSEVEGPGRHFRFPNGATVRRTGKKIAGRHLDGQLHDGYPA